MTQRQVIATSRAPKAIGPYSQAIVCAGILYCSGQIPLDPTTGKIVDGGIEQQAHQMFKNLQAVAQAAGTSLQDALKISLYLSNMDDFATINTIYGEYFSPPYPARSTIQVARLPLNALMEVDAMIKVNSK